MENGMITDVSAIEAEENLLIDFQFLAQAIMSKKGISRAKLAEKTGLSVARLSQIFNAEANPTVKTMAKIFHALGETVKLSSLANPLLDLEPSEFEQTAQWLCLEEDAQLARRQDAAMVASVKWSLASNDNFGRNVLTLEAEAA